MLRICRFPPDPHVVTVLSCGYPFAMITHAYIEAILRDGTLAEAVWELWNCSLIDDSLAVWLWFYIVIAVERGTVVGIGASDLMPLERQDGRRLATEAAARLLRLGLGPCNRERPAGLVRDLGRVAVQPGMFGIVVAHRPDSGKRPPLTCIDACRRETIPRPSGMP